MARTYDDPCGLARALNLIGDRWALLVVRELLLGPKRFTELRRGLPDASQSMLTSRLSELEEAGVIRRRRIGPPASAWGYELTDRGHDLEPALIELARWGSRSPLTSSAQLSVDALALALRTTFDPGAAHGIAVRCQLRLDGDSLLLTVRDGRLHVERGEATDVDIAIETSSAAFRSFVFGGRSLRGTDATIQGDRTRLRQIAGLFTRPTPEPQRRAPRQMA